MPDREWLYDPALMRLEATLRPYVWRRMTVAAVAHRLVEALDVDAGAVDEHGVWMVQRALGRCRWRQLTLAALAHEAAAALHTWELSRRRLDAELAQLLA